MGISVTLLTDGAVAMGDDCEASSTPLVMVSSDSVSMADVKTTSVVEYTFIVVASSIQRAR